MSRIFLTPHHFTISVDNLQDTIDWYREKLSFHLVKSAYKESVDAHVALLVMGDFFVEIVEKQNSAPLPEYFKSTAENLSIQGIKYFAFGVDNVDDTFNLLRKRGVIFLDEPAVGSLNFKYAIFKDNNGIPIEIFEIKEFQKSTKWSFRTFIRNLFKF